MSGDKMARSGHPREVLAHTSSKHTQRRRDIKETGCDDFPTFQQLPDHQGQCLCSQAEERKTFKVTSDHTELGLRKVLKGCAFISINLDEALESAPPPPPDFPHLPRPRKPRTNVPNKEETIQEHSYFGKFSYCFLILKKGPFGFSSFF